VRKRSRRTWWRSGPGVEICSSWVGLVLVGIPVALGCDALGALVGVSLLLTIVVVLLGWSLGSWVLGLVDAACICARWNGVLSSSLRPFSWGGVIAFEDSVDVMASSSAFLLRALLALAVLILSKVSDMVGGGCGNG
jgi:hypothetical protein